MSHLKLRKNVSAVLSVMVLAAALGVTSSCTSTDEEKDADDVEEEVQDLHI